MRCLNALVSCTAASAMLFFQSALSQEAVDAYPSKPVTLIVPASAGGPGDRETRLYATKLTELMGQSFIMDFKPGAGSTLGTAYVAKSRPDGYTLLVAVASFTTFPALYKDLPFDTIRDFAPVSQMTERTTVLLTHPSFPAKIFGEYISYARANPGKVNYGTAGAGSVSHLAGAWMHSATNTKVTFVHYKGTGDLMTDLFSGRVDVSPVNLLSALPLIKAGKARGLAVMGDKRSRLQPELRTIAEQDIPGYDYKSWQGVLAPGATPPAIVNKLSDGFARVAKMPDVAGPLQAEGSTTVGNTSAQFRQFLVAETDRWQKLVKETGISVNE